MCPYGIYLDFTVFPTSTSENTPNPRTQVGNGKVSEAMGRAYFQAHLGRIHMGGCQNYGPFLGPYCNTAPNI